MEDNRTARDRFLDAAFWFGSAKDGDTILAAHPDIRDDLHVAALLGDEATVRSHIARDADAVRRRGGSRNVDPLTCVCFSAYLRETPQRRSALLRTATALLDAGADIASGFFDETHSPKPEFESLLYGAAGVAHDADLTRLLLERGADPNDAETPYHSPETYDNRAVSVLIDSRKLTPDSLYVMLLRKADWHDYDGVKLVLDAGVDPNHVGTFGRSAFHHALLRDNRIEIIDLMLDRGADPAVRAATPATPATPAQDGIRIAVRRGRRDVLESFRRRGIPLELNGVDRLIFACAMDDGPAIDRLIREDPSLAEELRRDGATLLAEFAGTANVEGVARLLDLGVPIDSEYGGDPYFDRARDSSALHVASWHAWPRVVRLLISRGADVNAVDAKGRTPLMLAVKATVDSYWTNRRSPQVAESLLEAGASTGGVSFPSGYEAVDTLLRAYGCA